MDPFSRVLTGGKINTKHIPEIEKSTLITVSDPLKQYSSFFLCISLSAIIATCGIAAESTAIIIGAMLIAPLMSPMIGTSFAITVGKPRAALKTLGITLAGTVIVVAVSMLVTLIIPTGVSLTGNVEVASRVAPRVVDLIVAVASGLVGALAIARDDIFDVIPGVAISISVVPPLCVVGAALVGGDIVIASGALLLFIVNFFAIQLAGNILFYFMGFAKRTTDEGQVRVRRFWYITAVVGTLLLAAPLVATSNQMIETATMERSAKAAVRAWLEDTDYEVASTVITEDKLIVEIAGDGDYPSVEDLKAELSKSNINFEKTSIMVMNEYH